VELRVRDVSALTPDDERELVALVARTFPDEPALKGRWYFDSEPSFLVEAREEGALLGVRVVVPRALDVAGRAVRAAGFGIAVAPEAQRKGVGTALTTRTVAEAKARGFDVALAFLFSDNAVRLLERAGFRRLRARVSYDARETGLRVVESMPCYARGLVDDVIVDAIDAGGALHLGVGTW
jgi:ribosomal protein S18 acetylase RimI-like enzyme